MKKTDIWFSSLEISNTLKLKLLECFENSTNIWDAKEDEFLENGITNNVIKEIFNSKNRLNLDKLENFLEMKEIKLILYNTEEYPNSLKFIKNKPSFLFIRGELENMYDDCIAIIGSRNASDYGKFVARKFSKEIADKNVNIVSGLAVGIDKYAHLGALDSKIGKTIAVLGTGVLDNDIYPLENKRVFERILENKGTIISEFKLGTKPEKWNFPLRNRIISGLSQKIIVVEATKKSGSLITVDYALEQGKEIYAVPGNIISVNSSGTNKLIAEGARVLTDSEDVFFPEF